MNRESRSRDPTFDVHEFVDERRQNELHRDVQFVAAAND